MKQLSLNLKSGHIQILDVPFPALVKGNVLVRNQYSLISSGTEGSRVVASRKGYVGKAKERPDQFKQVLVNIKKEGIVNTYNKVMNRLDSLSSIGYSCAGEVMEVGEGVSEFEVGDYVACGGRNAVHADVVSVPKNLCVKVPPSVDLKHAAFTTIGAIALQGIRLTELKLGENCVVIGLGLIGQITIQLLEAGGIHGIGIDIDNNRVELSKRLGAKLSLERNNPSLEKIVMDFTKGYGTDAVIITAATPSLDPVELAGVLNRKKGKVIIVGKVPTGFSRKSYYEKELELLMSCSYGPGRYDAVYEEKGIDYPIGYVRWTENRNMQAFLELLKYKKICLDPLISQIVDFVEAEKAYKMILEKPKPFVGLLLKYDINRGIKNIVEFRAESYSGSKVNVGFIGAGSFAQHKLLPLSQIHANMIGVSTRKSINARHIADKYSFRYCTGDADKVIHDKKINTIFITTRHNLHTEYVIKALRRNKNVFVEKPLCMNVNELELIREEYIKKNVHLMVGFNRRFAPLITKLKQEFIDDQTCSIIYRINVGQIPNDHWTQDKDIGGGRIIGEVCHFIDLVMFLVGGLPNVIFAQTLNDPLNLMNTVSINIKYTNGSIANINYFANGSNRLGKEYLEIYSKGRCAILDDFKILNIFDKKKRKIRLSKKDKGHKNEVEAFFSAIKDGSNTPISFEDIYYSTLTTFKVIESIISNKAVKFQK